MVLKEGIEKYKNYAIQNPELKYSIDLLDNKLNTINKKDLETINLEDVSYEDVTDYYEKLYDSILDKII